MIYCICNKPTLKDDCPGIILFVGPRSKYFKAHLHIHSSNVKETGHKFRHVCLSWKNSTGEKKWFRLQRYFIHKLVLTLLEPHNEKIYKRFCAVTAKLIGAFVFASRIVQSLYLLNSKFQASSHLLWLHLM